MGGEHNKEVQRAIGAYAAGFECGRFGATMANTSAEHARTHHAEREWLRGYNDGRAAALPVSPAQSAA